jgi:hypothetical protein
MDGRKSGFSLSPSLLMVSMKLLGKDILDMTKFFFIFFNGLKNEQLLVFIFEIFSKIKQKPTSLIISIIL